MSACKKQSPSWLESRLQATEILMQECVLPTGAQRLDDLITYHLESGGARTRAKLALFSAQALVLPDQSCVALAACCELIHNASLLHDDIQDQDVERRGLEAAWRKFDASTAMCAGTLLLSGAYRALAVVPSSSAELMTHAHKRVTDLITGQVLDLLALTDQPDLDDYLRIAAGKSGSLLALPLELSLIAAQEQESLPMATSAGHAFAMAYQIIDDLTDVDIDLSQGHNNVVGVLMRMGNDRETALETARALAREHLEQTVIFAQALPAGSGQALVQLCEQLERSVLVSLRLQGQTG
jgi:geranylgeranyl diphosphate synthase type II